MYNSNNIFNVSMNSAGNWELLCKDLKSLENLSVESFQIVSKENRKKLFFYEENQLKSDFTPEEFAKFYNSISYELQKKLIVFVKTGYKQKSAQHRINESEIVNVVIDNQKCSQKLIDSTPQFTSEAGEYLKDTSLLLFYHNHLDVSSYQILAKSMELFKEKGVGKIYLEFPAGATSIIFAVYNLTGDKELFKSFATVLPEANDGILILAEAAFKAGVKLIPVDEAIPTQVKPVAETNQSFLQRNVEIADNIIAHMNTHGTKKAIGLFGMQHSGINQLISEKSDGISNKSCALMAQQFFNFHYFLKALRVNEKAEKCNYFLKIPDLTNQETRLTSEERMHRNDYYFNYTFETVKSCCFFPCIVVSKAFNSCIPTLEHNESISMRKEM